MKKKKDYFPYLMSLPAFACILLVCLYPVFSGIYTSFTDTALNNISNAKFVGLDNFARAVGDETLWKAIRFTFVYTIISVSLSYLVGLACALMMNRKMRFRSLIRGMLLLPWVIPAVVGTTAWMWILNAQSGIVNIILKQIGVIQQSIDFLGSKPTVWITVILFCVWKNFPFMALVVLAALQGISSDIIESSKIDGASAVQTFLSITLPNIKRESLMAILLMCIWTFNNFDYIYLMTMGGPAQATQTVSIYSYYLAFSRNNLSYASAIAVIMMAFMILLTVLYNKATADREVS